MDKSVFSNSVYNIVRAIPRGATLTYQEVARHAGKPKAYRAVGNILNKNRDFKNIPCHRVVRSDGNIGGYVLGSSKKRALLKKESII
ncbi:MAG: MGMT family protein [bacterium]|nr:MGMT family protein [bacterium]